MKVLLFAQLSELFGAKEIVVPPMKDTQALTQYLHARYHGFSDIPYIIAVEKELIQENTGLKDDSVVAFLPPYSGG